MSSKSAGELEARDTVICALVPSPEPAQLGIAQTFLEAVSSNEIETIFVVQRPNLESFSAPPFCLKWKLRTKLLARPSFLLRYTFHDRIEKGSPDRGGHATCVVRNCASTELDCSSPGELVGEFVELVKLRYVEASLYLSTALPATSRSRLQNY